MNNHTLEHIHEVVNHGAHDLTDRVREETIKLSKKRRGLGYKAFLYPIFLLVATLTNLSTSSIDYTKPLEEFFLTPRTLYQKPAGPKKPSNLGLRIYDDPKMRRIVSYLPDSEAYLGTVFKLSKKSGINPLEGVALITCESNWNPYKSSKKGCVGLTQLNPEFHDFDPKNQYQILETGFRYLKELKIRYSEFNQDRTGYSFNPVALAAYNLGPTKVDTLFSHGWNGDPSKIPVEETKRHVAKVDSILTELTKL
ncbi:MAG: transglycosylase SLT domain-containing protein [archaeon]